MTSIKPNLDPATVAAFLRDHLGVPVEDVRALQGGEICRAFAYATAGDWYVIRFAMHEGGFRRDRYACEHVAPLGVPIPRMHEIGRFGANAFAISAYIPGSTIWRLPAEEQETIAPALVTMLDRIHQTDVGSTQGYGYLDDAGVGSFSDWPTYLRSVAEEDPDDLFGRWHRLFDESFLERPVFERLNAEMLSLLVYCPEDRFLVHGDFGFDNVLVEDGRITAVLDWANMKYGDFLFDVAWLNFWPSSTRYADLSQRYYEEHGRAVPYFAERLRCYTCHIALDALRFYAHTGQREAYVWARTRAMSLTGSGADSGAGDR